MDNLIDRCEQLNEFKGDPNTLFKVTYINKLFGAPSFINAIKQMTAQEKKLPLNELFVKTDVQKM